MKNGTITVGIELPVKLGQRFKAFCTRSELTQPQVIRTLVFNLISTHSGLSNRKTPFSRNARRLSWHAERYTGGLRHIDTAFSVEQFKWLCQFCDASDLNIDETIHALIQNFIVTTKPGKSQDAFLRTARQLMSRQPSSPHWGNGCERTPDERLTLAIAFIRERPTLSPGKIAAAMRGLGIRRSKQWIKDMR